ncbi:NAD-dependent epimerase/dehydratase family protein [Hoyosella sp. G463]|uniref:UDP-glucose 4-epimerase n=1 Tax=Lolliginicoccus lacisalsi TaxID=2742202 RepID=A0A927JAC0_9ACTN|nr:NAD-dependent epimerase/dehydratase family protein [Lolliginicoccus lacisalsi]MBD8505022.1 NAD-dependent epimerase/dehydratase family protein [Lolliginicoccus lacisalsi]
MRVLLTGAAGFIGAAVHARLVSEGHDVVAVDAMLPSAHGPAARDHIATDGAITVVDMRDRAGLDAVLGEVDVVCHQAAIVGAGVDAADAPAFASHNDLGTATLLAAMAAAGCERLVLASSMVVYGEGRYRCAQHGEQDPPSRDPAALRDGTFDLACPRCGSPLEWALVDEDAPLRPRSLYAASKTAQEHYALAWARATGGQVTALRYHNVYGAGMPRDTPYSGVAAMWRSALEAGQAPRVYEDGRQMRDFVEVRDVAELNARAVAEPLGGFTALNACSGQPVRIGEVATALAAATGGPQPVTTGQFRPGDVRHIVASPRRAEQLLGFRAAIGPEAGLREFAVAPLRSVDGLSRPSI